MDICVYCSHDFERLAKELVLRVDEFRQSTSEQGVVFRWAAPVTVIVPSLELGVYLEQVISRVDGAAINCEFTTLQKFLNTRVEEAAGERFEILDREVMKTLLLEIFADAERIPDEARGPVERYVDVDDAGAGGESTRQTRRYQLARTVATCFQEYILSRWEMLEKWSAGGSVFDDADEHVAELESWQAALWRHINRDERYLPLPEAFDKVCNAVVEKLQEENRGMLHFFGFAGFGAQYLKMLGQFGRGLDVQIYFCSPTRRELENVGEMTSLHPALASWSDVGRETLEQLEVLAEGQFYRLDAPGKSPDTLLGNLQQSISVGTAPQDHTGPDSEYETGDSARSLSFLRCPGQRREVEVVANEIWKLMGSDEDLRFSDIAVVLAEEESDAYLAHLESVFEQFEGLPYNINGLSLRGRSSVMDAAELLLGLPFGGFTRQELLALLVHPNFASRFRDVEATTWIEWAQSLNIFYGADRKFHERAGTYLESDDLFNWDQGMKRLALGAFLQVDDAPDDGRVTIDGFDYLPEEFSTSEMKPASALNAAVSSLGHDALWLGAEDTTYTLEEWAEILSELVETYVVAATSDDADYEDDLMALRRIQDALRAVEELPDIGTVSYRMAYLYAMDRLAAIDVPGGQWFSGGVIVSTPKRLRALPFKHVFLLGAGEGKFPTPDPRSELDLRLARRKSGDILPSQRDKYHFLEILQAAEDSLSLSWVARESSTGEDLPPSSIIGDLRRMIPVRRDKEEGEKSEFERLTIEHPLRRYDTRAYEFIGLPVGEDTCPHESGRNFQKEAFVEAQLQAIRNACLDDEYRGRTIWTGRTFREVQRRLTELQNGKRGGLPLRMIEPPARDETGGMAEQVERQSDQLRDQISISKLSSFLKSPLQAKARTTMRIYDDDDDEVAEDRESFVFSPLTRAIVANEAFRRMLEKPATLKEEAAAAEAIRNVLRERYRPGDVPVELFGDLQVRKIAEELRIIGKNLVDFFSDRFCIDLSEYEGPLELSVRPEDGQVLAPKIALGPVEASESNRCSLVGNTPPYFPGDAYDVILAITTSKKAKFKDHFTSYMAHLALSAVGGKYDDVTRKSVVIPANDWTSGPQESSYTGKLSLALPPISASSARQYLSSLLSDLLINDAVELLPVEVVEKAAKVALSREGAWQFAMERVASAGPNYGGIRTKYGPVKNYLDYPPPKEPMKTIGERFKYHEELGAAGAEEGK